MSQNKTSKLKSKTLLETKSNASDDTNESENIASLNVKRPCPFTFENSSAKNKKIPIKTTSPSSVDSDDDESEALSPRVRKVRIQKFYEVIYDNDRVYKYEDDPNEYKKARKRIQNRESACRVRHRKANNTEQLKAQLQSLKDEMLSLKQQNSTLSTENVILKQQIFVYENILVSKRQTPNEAAFSLMNFQME